MKELIVPSHPRTDHLIKAHLSCRKLCTQLLFLAFMRTVEPREIQVGTPPRPVWDVINKSCPCWLRLDLDLSPMSIESKSDAAEPVLARKLSTRWKRQGTLIYAEQRT